MADSVVREAQERYQDAISVQSDQRKQIAEDLEFSDPANPQQWDAEDKRLRETDPGGARPCLVMDQCGQYVSNVAGQVEQRPPALHALPVGDGADQRVAEILDGHFRHIEHASRAQQHYARALTAAARVGVGYLIVRPEFTDRALGFQEPRISSEGDPLRVCFDPWSVEIDGSDANFGFLLTPVSNAEFERRYGKRKKKASFGEDEQQGASKRDARESVILAEEWQVREDTVTMLFCVDPMSDKPDDVFALREDEYLNRVQNGQQLQLTTDAAGRQNYTDKVRKVIWRRMSGYEVLTEEQEYPSNSIGIVPVYGYVGWAGGRMTYCGIPRRAREPQRAYNYHVSEIRAIMSLAPRAPWLLPLRALGGDENLKKLWDKASAQTRAYLPYNDIDEQGPVAPPSRMQVTVNLQNHVQGALQAKEDIQSAIGMYQANLGAPSNETSGVAIDSRKQQGEASTAHFPSHLAASLTQVGRICVDMIPRLVDSRRQLRMLSIDNTPSSVMVDPQQQQSIVDGQKGVSINPNVGKYDARVVVGASFSTQRQQAQAAYTEMMRASPQMISVIGPLWAQTLDVPHADKLAQVLTASAPDAVKAILQPNQQDSVPALKAQIEQLGQALQEAIQHAQEAQREADEAHQQLDSKQIDAEAKDDEIAIRAHEAVTKRLQVLGTALTPETVQQIATQTAMAAMQQPQPSEEPVETAEMPATPTVMQPTTMQPESEEQGPSAEVHELMQGQEHVAQLLEMLIKLVQAPRERIPVHSKDGSIARVIDRIAKEPQPIDTGSLQ